MSLPVREEERQKTIVSVLLKRPTHVIWDNVQGQVHSPSLEGLLTTLTYSARLLGGNGNAALPVTGTTWFLTANNAQFSPDLATRSVYVRLDAKYERPEERTGFKIPDLKRWIADHRAEFLEKVLIIVAHWVGQGMPLYKGDRQHRLGRWRDVMGGVLESIEMGEHFLTNTDALRESADAETTAWCAFVNDWHAEFGAEGVKVTQLMPVAFGKPVSEYSNARSEGPLELFAGVPTDSQRKVKLGLWLAQKNGRIYEGYRISVKRDSKRGNTVQLTSITADNSGTLAKQIGAMSEAPSSSQRETLVQTPIEPHLEESVEEDEGWDTSPWR